MKCPLPVLKTRKALARLEPGTLLSVSCTDPMAVIDLPNLARETGDVYEGTDREAGFTVHRIRRKAD
ncbi:MAG: sulfurtransferase TusA family protein [Labrys sp. (in: a-proteobacteria)]